MSIVGTRPPTLDEWNKYELHHRARLAYSKLIDRKILLDNQIFHDEVLRQGAEGLEFNLRLFEKLESAIFINKPFYHYIYNSLVCFRICCFILWCLDCIRSLFPGKTHH